MYPQTKVRLMKNVLSLEKFLDLDITKPNMCEKQRKNLVIKLHLVRLRISNISPEGLMC